MQEKTTYLSKTTKNVIYVNSVATQHICITQFGQFTSLPHTFSRN